MRSELLKGGTWSPPSQTHTSKPTRVEFHSLMCLRGGGWSLQCKLTLPLGTKKGERESIFQFLEHHFMPAFLKAGVDAGLSLG